LPGTTSALWGPGVGRHCLNSAKCIGYGRAQFITWELPTGSHSISASYRGAYGFVPSTSAALTEVVLPDQVIVTVAQNSQSVSAGQSAVYNLAVSAEGPLAQPVTFSCLGLPASTTCSFSPASITASSSATFVTLTMATTARETAQLVTPVHMREQRLTYAFALVVPGIVLLGAGIGRGKQLRHSKRLTVGGILSALMLLCLLVGCGGGEKTTTTPPSNGTPAGNYTVGITATSGTLQTTVAVTLRLS
jgi:hypothetical protein